MAGYQGICYGYRVWRKFDNNWGPVRGLHSNDTNEAATIVWIFERYADDMSPIRIASELSPCRYRALGQAAAVNRNSRLS